MMYRTHNISITLRALSFIIFSTLASCGKEIKSKALVTDPTPNQAPTVSAGANKSITLPTISTSLTATATDASPLTYNWSKVSGAGNVSFSAPSALSTTAIFSVAGTYNLRFTASDGSLSSSDDVIVTVNAAPNVAPVVNAGADKTITLPTNATSLVATATDASPLTYSWTKISGAGTVTFSAATALTTTATFSSAGTYNLRFTANDGSLSSSDDVIVIVNPTPNVAPVVNAGVDKSITLPINATSLVATATDASPLTYAWTKVSGAGTVTFSAATALTTTATFSITGTYTLRLTANDGSLSAFDDVVVTVNAAPNVAPIVNAGTDQSITLPTNATSLIATATDASPLTYAWTKVSGAGTVTFSAAAALTTTATFSIAGTYTLRLTASDGSMSAFDDVIVTVNPATNVSIIANAGLDKLITLPTNNTSLIATATSTSPLTYAWSKVSGAGTVTFSAATALTTTATFSIAGTYTLRFTASNGSLSSSDDVIVTVNAAPNVAPVVNAGVDKTITLPTNATSLVATATDASPLTYAWTKVSGAGTVTFSAATALTTTATFSSAGTYNLRFTANDGSMSAFDELLVTVNAAPIVSVASKLSLSGPSSVLAGSCSGAFQVMSQDQDNLEKAVTQSSPITISGLGTAVLYSNNTCTTALSAPTLAPGASRLTFYIKDTSYDREALPLTLNLSAQTSGLSVSNSLSFVENHGVATKLVFSRQPSSTAVEEEVLPIQPIVKVQDASSNKVSSSSATITLTAMSDATCSTAAPGIFFGGDKDASAGTASFNLVRYMQPGTIYLKASASGLSSACSSAINLTALGPETFTLTINIMGNGDGNVQASRSNTGNNISCNMTDGVQSGSCEVQAPIGTVFKLFPYKVSPSHFQGFSGTTCAYNSADTTDLNNCGFTITGDLEVDVYFQESEFAYASQGLATISNVTVSAITRNSATITWTTAKAADSKVRYGLTNTFGIHSSLDSEYTTSHTVVLEGLSPNTLYNYRAHSRDVTGYLNQSGTLTFTTAP